MRSKKKRNSTALGRPVSVALQNGPKGDAFIWKESLKAIDRVHGDGKLPETLIFWDDNLPGVAKFRYDPATGGMILLNPRNIVHDLKEAFVHEIGHLLDAGALSPFDAGWASRHSPELEMWRQAVTATNAYAALRGLSDKISVEEIATGNIISINQKIVEYYLRREELFARCYSQWIIFRAEDSQLTEWYNQTIAAPLLYPSLWTPEDFAPVAEEMDALFRGKGWMI